MELGQRAVERLDLTPAAEQSPLAGSFGGVYAGRRVLVTGHTGFKGSWLALWLCALGAQVHGLALPAPALSHWASLDLDVPSHWVDVLDPRAVRVALDAVQPDIVFHLAAQALVSEGYRAPCHTFATNVLGLVHVLEAVRATPSVRAVVNVTSDKCYELPTGAHVPRHEDHPLGGADPYSASKGCAEIVAASYARSVLGSRVRLASARAGNVIGGGDWSADRLLPDLMRAAARGAATPLRRPAAVRPWQHVLEPLAGYLRLGQVLLRGPASARLAYNFGPSADDHWTVGAVVAQAQTCWPAVQACALADAPMVESAVLRLDASAARSELGWAPVWSTAQTIERSVAWYRTLHETGRVVTAEQLAQYVCDAAAAGLSWALPLRAAA